LIIELVAMPFWPQKLAAASLIALMGFSALFALALLQWGHFRAASAVYLGGSWLIFTIIIILGGGARSQDTVFYIALSISAAWLIGYRAALLVVGACASALLIMAVLEVKGVVMPHYFTGEPIPNWVNFVVATVIAAVPTGRALQVLKNALTRSQEAESALREQQEHLEELVQQRTAEVVEARDQAEAANRAKTVFLAKMSHELRTPLNAILGFSAMVGTDAGLTDQHRKDLAVVRRSGEHLLVLIDDVLDMARIETGRVPVESASFDVLALVNDTVNMVRDRAHAKNLDLAVAISANAPRFVCSDAGKLRQVLANLVGNALKYTDEGRVTVSVDVQPGDNRENCVLIFEVEDTGIGISPEDQARIFDPFVQAANANRREGTGLGLSIRQNFVRLLGGRIYLDSTPGRGSRFRVELPARKAAAAEQGGQEEAVVGLEPGQPEYRVLIVEDQVENWLLLERLLREAGFKTLVAEDGIKAIEAFSAWRPHFIWMDLRLPVLSGLDVAKRLRELEGGRDVKIVAVTASAFASHREEVLAAGMDDFVRKPYRPREIFECMKRHLGVRYVYEPAQESTRAEPSLAIIAEDLAALPAALQDELENAVIALDCGKIARVVRRISEHNAALGSAIMGLADVLAYTPIFDALRKSKIKIAEAHR
jgi:signal transduction histidine kinase/CheY-like chemotaxis protein